MKLTCNIPYCNKILTDIRYRIQKNNTKHLVGLCSLHGWRYLEFRPDLKIPTVLTNLKSKKHNGIRIPTVDIRQQSLI